MNDGSLVNKTASVLAREKRSSPGQVGGRLKRALLAMIWENVSDNEAAIKFGITVIAIRSALKRPAVRQFVKGERQVLLAREQAKNPHALAKVRDTSANGVAVVSAVKAIEELATEERASAAIAHQRPGLVIVVTQPEAPKINMGDNVASPLIIDAAPSITPAKRIDHKEEK